MGSVRCDLFDHDLWHRRMRCGCILGGKRETSFDSPYYWTFFVVDLMCGGPKLQKQTQLSGQRERRNLMIFCDFP
jgi:hypothetical protein